MVELKQNNEVVRSWKMLKTLHREETLFIFFSKDFGRHAVEFHISLLFPEPSHKMWKRYFQNNFWNNADFMLAVMDRTSWESDNSILYISEMSASRWLPAMAGKTH